MVVRIRSVSIERCSITRVRERSIQKILKDTPLRRTSRSDQIAHPRRYFPRNAQQRGDQLLIDIRVAPIFGEIALAMCLIQHALLPLRQIKRVLQALKDEVARLGAVSAMTQLQLADADQVIELWMTHRPSPSAPGACRQELG
jgi:hypothetical protein